MVNRTKTGGVIALAVAGIALVAACSSSDLATPTGGLTEAGVVPTPSDGGGAATCGALTSCSGTCVDTKNDSANCGACGKACGAGEACSKGACTTTCPADQAMCGSGAASSCVTLATDSAHCGACDTACASGEVCSAGKCALSCQASYALCSGKPFVPDAGADAGDAGDAATDAATDAGPLKPYCAALVTDDDNCGACGKSCAYGEKCSGSACCAGGSLGCGGSCKNVQVDANNCGACNKVCPVATKFCQAGACTKCPTGSTDPGTGTCSGSLNVPLADTTGLSNDCGNGGRYNACNATPFGFHWEDVAGVKPTQLVIEANAGLNCGTQTLNVALNGTNVGTMTFNGGCTCTPTPTVRSVTVTGANLDLLVLSGTNAVSFNGATSCTGLVANAGWDGGFGRLTSTY